MALTTLILDRTELEEGLVTDLVEGLIEDEVEIVITDPGHMRVLNRRFRHIDRPTDVLSFDLADAGDTGPEGTIFVDGRVFPPLSALLERIFHGYLHLRGFSHDTGRDAVSMEEEVRRMVSSALEKTPESR